MIGSRRKDGTFSVLERDRVAMALSSKLNQEDALTAAAAQALIDLLKSYRRRAAALSVPLRAVATAAMRRASNREEVLERVRREAGVRLELITGEEEARLAFLGVMAASSGAMERRLVIDVGGGSTELATRLPDGRFVSCSFPVGAVRLTQEHLHHRDDSDRLMRMTAAASTELLGHHPAR